MRGRDKLLEPVAGGKPLLAERVATARATGAPVLLALPPEARAPGRWAAIAEAGGAGGIGTAGVQAVTVEKGGMGDSLAALARALPAGAKGALILPADMPDITLGDLKQLLQAFDGRHIFRGASAGGAAGHPVIFPRAMFAGLRALSGEGGARELLKGAEIRLVPLPGAHALTDLDTPEDWQAWRQRQAE